eukprot:SAG31_NODE_406_length_16063_cov_22.636056_6_plen_73_part_00
MVIGLWPCQINVSVLGCNMAGAGGRFDFHIASGGVARGGASGPTVRHEFDHATMQFHNTNFSGYVLNLDLHL